MSEKSLISSEVISRRIYVFRGHKVMLDFDLAKLYKVETRQLNQAIKRNPERFPNDFMFELNMEEIAFLRSNKILSAGKRGGHTKYTTRVFTEQGVAMLSSVLKSKQAIQVNIEIMRAFVKLKQMLSSHKDLVQKINMMEKKYDHQFKAVFDAIRRLMEPPVSEKKKIGFNR